MKSEKTLLNVTAVLIAFTAGVWTVQAAHAQVLRWNESARSSILNRSELAKQSDALPAWKMKQMVWPSPEELSSSAVAVNDDLKDECVAWLTRFLDTGQAPADIREHLVAMRAWGSIREESKQKRPCDVFITRFQKGSQTVHIQESPANVVITVASEAPTPAVQASHKDLLFDTAAHLLKEGLRPNPRSESLHLTSEDRGGIAITKADWVPESVAAEDPQGRKVLDGAQAQTLGTWSLKAETDGRYVRFIIHKYVGSVPPDPYIERFAATK